MLICSSVSFSPGAFTLNRRCGDTLTPYAMMSKVRDYEVCPGSSSETCSEQWGLLLLAQMGWLYHLVSRLAWPKPHKWRYHSILYLWWLVQESVCYSTQVSDGQFGKEKFFLLAGLRWWDVSPELILPIIASSVLWKDVKRQSVKEGLEWLIHIPCC